MSWSYVSIQITQFLSHSQVPHMAGRHHSGNYKTFSPTESCPELLQNGDNQEAEGLIYKDDTIVCAFQVGKFLWPLF